MVGVADNGETRGEPLPQIMTVTGKGVGGGLVDRAANPQTYGGKPKEALL